MTKYNDKIDQVFTQDKKYLTKNIKIKDKLLNSLRKK